MHMQLAKTPAEVVQRCDMTFAMLSDPAAALDVAIGADGIVKGESKQALVGCTPCWWSGCMVESHQSDLLSIQPPAAVTSCTDGLWGTSAMLHVMLGADPLPDRPGHPGKLHYRKLADAAMAGAAGMAAGKGYVDVSTVDAATSQQIAAAVRAAGGLFLEAPVSGSKGPAEQGALIFLTGGVCP